jgi:DNA-3-methyladenine glycosylase
MPYLTQDFFDRDTLEVARDLIGAVIVVGKCEVKIVETEAYKNDPASHSVMRPKTATMMRDTYGHIYVYQSYGVHYCMNFTTERKGIGAVLIRAGEPLKGLELMAERRGLSEPRLLASGPGRLCQAMGVDMAFSGLKIGRELKVRPRTATPRIASSPRIGITRATELEWRFFDVDSPYVSRRLRMPKNPSKGG